MIDLTDEELLKRAVRSARRSRKMPRWVEVGDLFALGSTSAMQLCKRFSVEPEEIVKSRRSRA